MLVSVSGGGDRDKDKNKAFYKRYSALSFIIALLAINNSNINNSNKDKKNI